MRKLSIFLMFLVFVSFVNPHSLGRFLIDEPLERGEIGIAYITIRNNFNFKLEDVNVNLPIYDLGLRYVSVPGDVSKRDHVVQRLFMYIPENIPAGKYLAKIIVGNDHYKDTQHVYLTIV